MAVSKHTRRPVSETNQKLQKLFRNSMASSDGREQEWRKALDHTETGMPPLRFPIYEHLYFLNIYSQRLVDLIREITGKFGISRRDSLYHESLIQQVRAGVAGDVLDRMHGVEVTEEWLFGSLRREEEKGFHDPDDVYLEVQKREKERIKDGLAPRICFLDEDAVKNKRATTTRKSNKVHSGLSR
jgi:hypothetical protein